MSRLGLAIALILLAACAPARMTQEQPAQQRVATSLVPSRAMTMIVRFEVNDLSPKLPGGGLPVVTRRLFNAALSLVDRRGEHHPYLAAALPTLNGDDWRVFPDGQMETTYRLRPGLTWQDGQPLTGDDFAFAYRVYTAPGLGGFTPTPQDRMSDVAAPDPATVVIRWRTLHADAGLLKYGDLDPLPRHILDPSFSAFLSDPAAKEVFLSQPYWTVEYVGAGPYRLERWEPGSRMELSAFDGHALGRPKIERIILRIIADENTVLSTVLAGDTDFTADFTLRFEHARVLQRDWEPSGRGVVVLKPSSAVSNTIQLRPEYAGHPGQLDVRVRRALAHTIDRDLLNQGLFEGSGFVTENAVPSGVPYADDVERTMSKHPFDLRRAEQLMNEAGYGKDRDGLFANPAGERFHIEFRVNAGPEFERSAAILLDTWRRAGLDVSSSILPANMLRDLEALHSFPGMATRGGGLQERTWLSREIGLPATRWIGENRAGWVSPEYDSVFEAFGSSLDRTERARAVIRMQQLVSQSLPTLVLYQAIQVNTRSTALVGPEPEVPGFGVATPGTTHYWNIHDWHFRG